MSEKKLYECKMCGAIDSDEELVMVCTIGDPPADVRVVRLFLACKRCGNMRMKVDGEV